MKKLGFLPRDFNLKEFLVKSTGQRDCRVLRRRNQDGLDAELGSARPAGTDSGARTHPRLAGSELRSAQVDEGCGLKPAESNDSKANSDNDDSPTARKAVVEGQAMVVYVDYLLAPLDRNLVDTPDLSIRWKSPR